MKKTTILSVRAVLWPIANKDKRARSKDKGTKLKAYLLIILLYLLMGSLQAQENKAVDVTLKGIQIGQWVPDILITGLHNYKDANGKTASTAKLSDFKGKLLILDFWATWCAPCVAMIPKMDSLQGVFGDKVAFLSVTYQSASEVLPFMDRLERNRGKKFDLPLVTGDTVLVALFPHVSLPHYVWIDGDGVVRAITNHLEVNEANIKRLLAGSLVVAQKKDLRLDYQRDQSLLSGVNGGNGNSVLYHSLFTGHIQGIGSGRNMGQMEGLGRALYKLTYRNVSAAELFRMALGGEKVFYGKNRQLFEVADKEKLDFFGQRSEYVNWSKGYTYCYELIVPFAQKADQFSLQLRDLNAFFSDYKVSVQQRKVRCLVLKRIDEVDRLASKGGASLVNVSSLGFELKNALLSSLVLRLNVYHLQHSAFPVVDQTGYLGRVDIQGLANMSSVEQINKALLGYGLALVEQEQLIDMVVFADKVSGATQVNQSILNPLK